VLIGVPSTVAKHEVGLEVRSVKDTKTTRRACPRRL
jgi:hypothetical protein